MSIKYKQEPEYDSAMGNALETFQNLILLYLAGSITLTVLRSDFKTALREYYITLMILGLGEREPSEEDLLALEARLATEYILLDAFLTELSSGEVSEARALWRAGLYSAARGTYVYYTLPGAIVNLMPGLPGDVCLGNGLCGCWLEVSQLDDGSVAVVWNLNPDKEHCVVCEEYAANSPYTFTAEDIENATG